MKTGKIGQEYNIRFKAGLTSGIRENIPKIDVSAVEKQFKNINTECNLKNNKALSSMLVASANILEEASEKFHLPFKFLPPNVRVFDLHELTEPVEETCTGFCIGETNKIIKNEPPFLSTSVFLRNNPDNIDFYDTIAEDSYKSGYSASNHFLSKVLHELFHSIHLNLIYQKFGYEGDCEITREAYKNSKALFPSGLKYANSMNKIPPIEDMPIIFRFLGRYAAKSKMELFAETLTKLTAECVDEKTLELKTNPLNKLKNYPTCISKYVKGELS